MTDDAVSKTWFSQAVGSARDGNLDAALSAATASCVIEPGLAKHWRFLATLKTMGGDRDAAIMALGRAMTLDPGEVLQALSLGELLRQSGRGDQALACLRELAKRVPDDERVWINLAYTCQQLWRSLEAARAFRRVSCLNPEQIEFAFRDSLSLPALPRSIEDISTWRTRYENGIERLRRLPAILTNPADVLDAPAFYLAYHDEDDRRLMEALRRMMRTVAPSLEHEAPWLARWVGPRIQCRRIRVGFISEYFSGHTIGKLYQGFLRHLDKHRFEIVLIHMPATRKDEFRVYLETLADRVVTLPTGLSNQQNTVSDLELDVLFYPDLGMTAATYFLSYARLAPVQAVAWGHPDTTGLDTVDYFISSGALEPLGGDHHYTERLIRLTRLPCCFEAPAIPETVAPRSFWGLPEAGTLYACPQSLFKLHPEFDAVLAEIVDRDPGGYIVFIEGRYEIQTSVLKERWSARHPKLLERTIFLPRQSGERFLEFVGRIDVLLDPIHFGSGKTMYEAMLHGTPVVSWPGRFMRGRIVGAAYAQMEIADAPVVARLEDYASVAVSLGKDPARREDLRQRLRVAAREKLFSDISVVREFECFLQSAVDARAAGTLLPEGWRPDHLIPG